MPENSPGETWLLRGLLPRVSRSFYLSLRILPRAPGRSIGLAYLLARSADTLSDTGVIPAAARRKYLDQLWSQIQDGHDPALQQSMEQDFAGNSGIEQTLLRSLPAQLQMLGELDPADRRDIRELLSTLISGMQLDLERFDTDGEATIQTLASARETDDYCYRVAGCVGEFWTRILDRYQPAHGTTATRTRIEQAVDFGKALQLTNILRDLREDLQQGRCYLPATQLQQAGISAADLLDADAAPGVDALLGYWLQWALQLYGHGRQYIHDTPVRFWQARLAALWPALIGLRTLELLSRRAHWPAHPQRIKLSRRQVYTLLILSLPVMFSRRLCSVWLGKYENRLRNRLATIPPLPGADSESPPADR